MNRTTAHILIVMDEGIGNMIMLTPAIMAIQSLLPGVRITVLGKHPSLEILHGSTIHTISKPDPLHVYDFVVFTIMSFSMMKRYGRQLIDQCRGKVMQIPWEDKHIHESEYYMKIARVLGYEGPSPAPYCGYTDINVPWHNGERVIALSPTGLPLKKWQRKKWPYFKELAWRLSDFGLPIVLIGGKAEAKTFDSQEWPGVWNLMGKFTVPQTAGIIRRCTLFIGNDSGPAHMAAALGVKTFVLFGATSLSKNMPLGPDITIISKNLDCSPCQFSPAWEECSDWKCIRDIQVEDVLTNILPVIERADLRSMESDLEQ